MTVRQAVILAAGLGSRLGSHTHQLPKCLVPISGRPIIDYLVSDLLALGVEEIVVVVGFEASRIRQHLGRAFDGVTFTYVEARDFATTNNIVSLWAARAAIKPPFLLLESDLLLPAAALEALLPPDAMAVAPLTEGLRGTIVSLDGDGTVSELVVLRDQHPDLDRAGFYKTVNAYSIGVATWEHALLPCLAQRIANGQTSDFYEAAFGDAISAGLARLRAADISTHPWIEIDTPADLAVAEQLVLYRPPPAKGPDIPGKLQAVTSLTSERSGE